MWLCQEAGSEDYLQRADLMAESLDIAAEATQKRSLPRNMTPAMDEEYLPPLLRYNIKLLEVLAVNAASPFALNSQLKPLLQRSPHKYRFVVNVSAMEGKFYRKKTSNHPHTNMAKAALNMMTHTSAEDYAAEGIFMNSVDTGWINDENPLPDAARIAKDNFFQTPIDECVSAPHMPIRSRACRAMRR